MAGDVTGGAAGDTVSAALAALDRLAPEGAIGAAISGGGDSTALLILAARWAQARGRRIEAATVDHRLRLESAAEAAGAAALCARLDVPHQTLNAPDLREVGGNLSAAAREARIALLGGWARQRGLSAVALGHTLDDQAETVLLRLARGSGAEGLSAMAPVQMLAGTLWLRPLLNLRRQALREFLRAEGVPWAEDPTNEDPDYDRVKARRALAALAPVGIGAEGLARTAWHLRRQRRVLDRAMDQLATRARRWGVLGEARLDPGSMAADEPDTALRLLADTLVRVAGAAYRPRFRALSGLLEQVLSGAGFAVTLGGCNVRRLGPEVLICREAAACQGPVPLSAGAALWDGRWQITASGSWPPETMVAMLGEQGLAELRRKAEAGLFEAPDAWGAAPRQVRLTTPALVLAGELMAVPLADYLSRAVLAADCAVSVRFSTPGGLPPMGPPAYGPAGSLDPPP